MYIYICIHIIIFMFVHIFHLFCAKMVQRFSSMRRLSWSSWKARPSRRPRRQPLDPRNLQPWRLQLKPSTNWQKIQCKGGTMRGPGPHLWHILGMRFGCSKIAWSESNEPSDIPQRPVFGIKMWECTRNAVCELLRTETDCRNFNSLSYLEWRCLGFRMI